LSRGARGFVRGVESKEQGCESPSLLHPRVGEAEVRLGAVILA